MNNYDSYKVYFGRVYCLDAELCPTRILSELSKMCHMQIKQISLKDTAVGSQKAIEGPTLKLSMAPQMIANYQGVPLL